MKIEVKINPASWDHDSVHLGEKGYAYISKDRQRLGLVRCPECEKENYALAVSSGQCGWCPYQVKMEDILPHIPSEK